MKLASIVGARPQFIKAAMLSNAIRSVAAGRIREVLIHTGQHYDAELSEVFFRELAIPEPDVNLHVGSHTSGAQMGRIAEAIEQQLLKERPDRVLVYGDTNSTAAAALAAAYLHIPVAHVEAGLRGYNRRVPEEINRVVTDHIADLLFCPTPAAVTNLRREGIFEGIHLVGDVMYDCALAYAPVAEQRSRILERLNLVPKQYFLATIHRAENVDDPNRLRALVEALAEVNRRLAPVVWPVHPRTKKAMRVHGIDDCASLALTAPLPYLDMQRLIANGRCVLTDSGGLQKEAFFHRVPCLTLREESEWIETVENGFNRVVGTDPGLIIEAAAEARFPVEKTLPALYGDGQASRAILEILLELANP